MKDLIQTMGFRFGHPRLRTRGQRTFLAGALTLSLWNAPECGAAPDVLARLVPMPRQTTLTGGLLPLAGPWALAISTRSPADSLAARQLAEEAARRGWSWRMSASRPGVRQVVWEEAALGSPEGYRLVLEPDRIVVGAATPAGRHYAVQTLRQILRTSDAGTVPACIIDDAPALGTRGISIDISRGQIPTTDALAATIRTLAYYKLNTLFLYIENSFAFPSAPGAHAPDALDEHDARTLRLVADSCGVELIPIVQSLSHQELLLAVPEYNQFAERPAPRNPERPGKSGSSANSRDAARKPTLPPSPNPSLWGLLVRVLGYWGGGHTETDGLPATSTICPSDPAAVAFAQQLVGDVARAFGPDRVHVGGDEATEVGAGRSAETVRRHGRSAVIGGYLRKLRDGLAREGRRMMVYSDMIDAASAAPEWPRDMDLVVWNYAPDADFARADSLKRLGFESILLSSGIWDWRTFYPDAGRGFASIAAAAAAAKRMGARGTIASSWGDGGAESLPGNNWSSFAFAAASAWEARPAEPREFLGRFARAHHGHEAAPIAEVERLVGWQGIDGLAWNGRVFHRPPLVRTRGAEWLERMKRLRADMLAAGRVLDGKARNVSAHPEHVDVLRHAIRRYSYLADREISLDDAARRLGSNTSPARASADLAAPIEASIERLLDEHEFLTAEYRRLWERDCRSSGLAPNLERLDEQRAALRGILARLRAGELRPWRPGDLAPDDPPDREES